MSKLFFDGACRGNGTRFARCAIGFVIKTDGMVLARVGRRAPDAQTNNQAEYAALIAGLARARALGVQRLECCGDSLLVINQMKGTMKVENTKLRPLRDEGRRLAAQFERVTYTWIRRELNADADAMANLGMD
jgi:ribonuclease HI